MREKARQVILELVCGERQATCHGRTSAEQRLTLQHNVSLELRNSCLWGSDGCKICHTKNKQAVQARYMDMKGAVIQCYRLQ